MSVAALTTSYTPAIGARGDDHYESAEGDIYV